MNIEELEEAQSKARDVFVVDDKGLPIYDFMKLDLSCIPIKHFRLRYDEKGDVIYSIMDDRYLVIIIQSTNKKGGWYASIMLNNKYQLNHILRDYGLFMDGNTYYSSIDETHERLDFLLNIWAGIQQEAINKPERIMQYCVSRVPQTANRQNSIAYKRIVKVERVVQVSETPTPQGEHRSIELPVWSVMGHWRNYKSGKRVWIAPFLKGKARNDENVQCAGKEYKFVK